MHDYANKMGLARELIETLARYLIGFYRALIGLLARCVLYARVRVGARGIHLDYRYVRLCGGERRRNRGCWHGGLDV